MNPYENFDVKLFAEVNLRSIQKSGGVRTHNFCYTENNVNESVDDFEPIKLILQELFKKFAIC